jgi:uncharacterized protein
MTGYPQPPLPQPGGVVPPGQSTPGPQGTPDDRLMAMLSYLLTVVTGLLAPLIIYLIKMNESGYVRYHAAQSLNLSITGLVYATGSFMIGLILGVLTHGPGFLVIFPLLFAIGAGELIFLIMAGVAANRGDLFRIPTAACLPIVH